MEKLPVVLFFVLLFKWTESINYPQLIDLIRLHPGTSWATIFSCRKNEGVLLAKQLTSLNVRINVVGFDFEFVPLTPPNNGFFILDLNQPDSKNVLIKANEQKLFEIPFRWLISCNKLEHSNEKIVENFANLNILADSDVNLLDAETGQIKKIFKQHIGDKDLVLEEFASWTEGKLLVNDKLERMNSRRRRDLNGTILRSCIVVTNNDSLNHLNDYRDIHIDSITKVNYVLVNHLSNIVNATLHYSIKDTWGYKDAQDNWSGMIGELTRQEADIGGTPLFLTEDRVSIIEYIAMTTPTKSKFIFRQPKLSYVTNVFTLPFDRMVWAGICILVLVCSLMLYLTVKWEWKKREYVKDKSHEIEIRDSWIDSIFLAFAALCQQGAAHIPYSVSGRITTIFLFVSLMFLYTSYSANIVALLQSSSDNIQTLKDILKSRLDVGVDDTVFNHFYFSTAKEPVRRALYLQKVAPPGQKNKFMKIEDGIKKIRGGLFAFHVETGPGYKLISETFREDEKCGLKEIQFLQVPDPWLAIQKRSPYRKMLKVGLLKIQETGLQHREVSLIYTRKPICISRGSSFISVGLVDCYPAAVVLAGGLALGIIIFLLEIFVHHRSKDYIGRIRTVPQFSLFKTKYSH